ncbi:AAA family ATPase [Arsenicicoccus dermatophilus]|uniref:AAA family ATPase n=1 Tax=Arsenicicoccus dermatophilus TaxID=1076331 RepID=UPI001F4CB3A3|nr:AAA family ATPase [Arsenicicoccus dermatophilus]
MTRPSQGWRPEPDDVADVAHRLHLAVGTVIEGKDQQVRTAVTVLLAGGHLLLEDVPGVGKTMLAKSLAAAMDTAVRRVQFTPDLLPSDITGVSVFNQETRTFEFRPGAVFANVVIGDEINRASPKTQSALLEAMEEAQVTADGETMPLPRPFMVIATQNPIEMEGTYPLPEAQRDRFMARLSMGYPTADAELAMLRSHGEHLPLRELAPVTDARTVQDCVEAVRLLHAAEPVQQYVVDLVRATRTTSSLRLGASPRAALHLLRAARASAAVDGRDHVLPDDVQALAIPVLAHRVMPTGGSAAGPDAAADAIDQLLRSVPVAGVASRRRR